MSKIVLAGIVGGLTIVTGLLFYSANLRDSKSSDNGDDSDTESEVETEPKTKNRIRTNKKEELEIIEENPISNKRIRHATTSKNVSRPKSNTRRNRNR